MDQDLVDEGARNLVSYFQGKSYFDVKVDSHLDKQPDLVNIVYHINRGTATGYRTLNLPATNTSLRISLTPRIVIQKGKFFYNRGKFSQDLLKKSVASLTALYRNAGFTKASVTPAVSDTRSECRGNVYNRRRLSGPRS